MKGRQAELKKRLVCMGRKEICTFMGVQDWRTAKKRLIRMNLLQYDNNKPFFLKALYLRALIRMHLNN